ncbi:RIP metalloprotease RseP [Kurthia sibirica]|uniref:Zinc metalloprotease n=1 Tax=Kurthia sibirica TaxID=202750 RepID=A0A2U3AQW6_9BACL|nr:RIP metalloprotease RseP [Kurthia sibirica]PWI26931.1 RIP metalloprotease RseP [Kurthia sibirica]GEK32527.1 putative zinc metalloprotease Lmo1318 [Kurthia sibirica]
MQAIIAFILVFGSIVFFHELGHFIFAKRSGILVREFAIGFGPKILGIKRGETLYTIRLLPMGGYVRMAGEDMDTVELQPGYRIGFLLNDADEITRVVLNQNKQLPDMLFLEVEKADLLKGLWIEGYDEDEKLVRYSVARDAIIEENNQQTIIAPYDRTFNAKSLPKRTMTIFAGPLFNFILAVIFFSIIAFVQGIPTNDAVIANVVKDSPAQVAGVQKDDLVVAANGTAVKKWEQLSEVIQENAGKEITLDVKRDGEIKTVKVTPESKTVNKEKIGQIGIQYGIEYKKDPLMAIPYGFEQTYTFMVRIVEILGTLVTGSFTLDSLSGPVGIYKATEEVAKYGFMTLMSWAAMLSINLGIMNLLPLPALDGGRLLFFAYEAVRGKPIDKQKEGIIHFVGFALLMLLMIAVTWNDIQKFFF